MLSKDFIHNELASLALAFPNITIRYEFNSLIETHIVELSPVDEYYNNATLDDAWIEITKQFLNLFPSEDISFVSEDSTVRVQNAELTFNQQLSVQTPQLNQAFAQLLLNYSAKIDWESISIPHELVFRTYNEIIHSDIIANYALFDVGKIDVSLSATTNSGFTLSTVITNSKELTLHVDGPESFALAA